MVDRHVDAVKKHSEQETMAHFELDEVRSECEDLKNQLQETKETNKKLLEEMEEKQETWNSEVKGFYVCCFLIFNLNLKRQAFQWLK